MYLGFIFSNKMRGASDEHHVRNVNNETLATRPEKCNAKEGN